MIGKEYKVGLLTIAAIPREDMGLETLVFALGECAGLGDDWPARAREAAAPGVFLTPVPECYAAGARRVMELFQHYLFGEGRWEDLPPGGIGRG